MLSTKYSAISSQIVVALVFFSCFCYGQDGENLNICYDVTWISRPVNDSDPTQCIDSEHYPCHEETLLISDLPPTEEELKLMATLDEKYICDKRVGEACVKYTYWTRTDEPSEFNITRLCTKGIEAPHGVEVDSGCYDEELQGYTLEVCFCQDPMCNRAGQDIGINIGVFIAVTFAIFAR